MKIDDLKKWKQRQRKELEKQLAENKSIAANIKVEDSTTLQNDNYDKYIEKLEEMMDLYQTGNIAFVKFLMKNFFLLDLEEARKIARSQNSNSNLVMTEIGDQLSEREKRIGKFIC